MARATNKKGPAKSQKATKTAARKQAAPKAKAQKQVKAAAPEFQRVLLQRTLQEVTGKKVTSNDEFYVVDGNKIPKAAVVGAVGSTILVSTWKEIGVIEDVKTVKGTTVIIIDGVPVVIRDNQFFQILERGAVTPEAVAEEDVEEDEDEEEEDVDLEDDDEDEEEDDLEDDDEDDEDDEDLDDDDEDDDDEDLEDDDEDDDDDDDLDDDFDDEDDDEDDDDDWDDLDD